MTYFDIVSKLVGKIQPVGSSHVDSERFDNLKEMCHLVHRLIDQINDVSKNKDRPEHSMREMGKYADEFLTNLGK